MPLNEVGPVVYDESLAVASRALSPLPDRALIVRDILIDNVSASDTWIVNTSGKELARFDIRTTGNQQPLSSAFTNYPKSNDIFEVYNSTQQDNLIYPVPQGMTITVSSVGGATADITYSYQEVNNNEITPGMMNHPRGTRMVTPLVGFKSAAITVNGENVFDTQIGPNWFPNLFVDNSIPSNWVVRVLMMFLEGAGVNTFSGSANHKSTTKSLNVYRNGQQLFSRTDQGGIPLIGAASANGSANVVIGTELTPFPAFQQSDAFDWELLPLPLNFNEGTNYRFRLNVTGDVTGGADYSGARMMFLCDILTPGGV